jgi:hypothetical protein
VERLFNSGVWTSDKLNTMQDFNAANASTQSQNESLSYNSIPQATYNFMGEMKSIIDSTYASVNNVNYVTAPFGMAGTGSGDQYFPSCYASSQPFGQNFNCPGSSAGMNVGTGANHINATGTYNESSIINSGQGISGGANQAAFNIFNDASTKYDASNGVNFGQDSESGVDNAAIINDGSGIYGMSSYVINSGQGISGGANNAVIFNDASTKYDASNGVDFGQGNESRVDNVAVINDGSGIYAISSAFLGQYDRDTPSSLIQNPNLVNSSAVLHPSQTPMPLYATMPSMCSMAAGLNQGNEVFGTSAFVNSNGPPLVLPRRTTTDRAPSKPKFALKLMEILSMRECQNALRWMPDGTCFCILNIGDFVENVLGKHFRETKYSSFVSLFMILMIWCGSWW